MKKLSRILSRRRPDDADSDTEIIRQRRRAGTATPSSSPSPTPTPTSSGPAATGFHQLPSRRATNSKVVLARTHRALRNGVTGGCIIADGSFDVDQVRNDVSTEAVVRKTASHLTKTCPRCAAIDFPHLLDWKQGQPRPWVPLSHVLLPLPSLPPSPPADGDLPKGQPPSRAPQCPFCVFFRAMVGPVPMVDGTSKFHPYLRVRQAFERLEGIRERHELAGSVLMEVMTKQKSLPWGYLLRADQTDDDDMSAYLAKAELPVKASIKGRRVPALINPALPRCWLDFCAKHHAGTTCTVPEPVDAMPGLRLIDCNDMRVIAADEVAASQRGIEYLALSYAWAQTASDPSADATFDLPALSLRPNNLLPNDLSALFRDAITFTTTLGFRYLWIDRFCLQQVGSSERQRQIGLMGEIYSRSSLTLILATEDTTIVGIPGLSISREDQLSLKTENGLYTTSLVRPDLEVASSKWASRAWTFQEGLLSRRRLIFTPSQLYFQCRSLHCYESIALPLRLAPDLNLGRVFPIGDGCPKRSGEFKDLIRAYMCRDLSNNEERLDAFKALLREFARMDGLAVKHFLGLPLFHPDDFVTSHVVSETDRLAVSLGWICDWVDSFETTPTSPSCYRTDSFPSWTWLAWNLREGLTPADNRFSFNLVGERSPIVDGVSAAPKMEISIGFKDDTVLSWEIDGDAIARKDNTIMFLRLETFCFDMSFTMDKKMAHLQDAALTDGNKALIEAILAASSPPEQEDKNQRLQCLGVLVSGRNWKGETDCAATALICARRSWRQDDVWVRLGAVAIQCQSFAMDGEKNAVLRGWDVGEAGKKDLSVQLREIDLY